MRIVLDAADQDAARGLLAGRPVRTDGPEMLLVEGVDGREVNAILGRAGVWARRIRVERPGLEEAFLQLTVAEEETNATAPR